MINSSRLLAVMAVTLAQATLAAAQNATVEASHSIEEQRAAYAYCATVMNKPLHTHKLKQREGQLFVLGSDGSGVTVSEAKGLNRCAEETLRGARSRN